MMNEAVVATKDDAEDDKNLARVTAMEQRTGENDDSDDCNCIEEQTLTTQ
jgi:hypothetical protein